MGTLSKPILLLRRLAVHGAGIVVSLLLAGLAWHAISAMRNEHARLELQQNTLANMVLNEPRIRTEHERLSREVQLLNENLKNRSQIKLRMPNDAESLAQFSQLARNVGLAIKSYSPGQLTDSGFDVQITASGNYPNVCRFLDGLETIPFLCQVTQCSIAAPQRAGEVCALDLAIRVLNPGQVLPKFALARIKP